MVKNLLLFFLIFLAVSVNAYAAASGMAYTTADYEKIAIIIGIVILIFSPSKFRVVTIGTILGLVLAYLTYKYGVPFLISF